MAWTILGAAVLTLLARQVSLHTTQCTQCLMLGGSMEYMSTNEWTVLTKVRCAFMYSNCSADVVGQHILCWAIHKLLIVYPTPAFNSCRELWLQNLEASALNRECSGTATCHSAYNSVLHTSEHLMPSTDQRTLSTVPSSMLLCKLRVWLQ